MDEQENSTDEKPISEVVLHLSGKDMQLISDSFSDTEPCEDDQEFVVHINFNEMFRLLSIINNMTTQLKNIEKVVKDCPECVELTDLDAIEEALDKAYNFIVDAASLIVILRRSESRNHRILWLLKKLNTRVTSKVWRNIKLSELSLPNDIDKRIASKITTLDGLAEMAGNGITLDKIGLSTVDVEEVKFALRMLVRGLRIQAQNRKGDNNASGNDAKQPE